MARNMQLNLIDPLIRITVQETPKGNPVSYTKLLPIGLAVVMAAPVLLTETKTASADVRIRVGGKVKVRVGKRVRHHRVRRQRRPVRVTPRVRHRLHLGGSIRIGGGIVIGSTFAEPPPPPPCSCCDCGEPAVPAYYTPPPPPPPPAYSPARAPRVYAPTPPLQPMARLGIGMFAGSMDSDGAQADDVGLLARYRLTPGWAVEAELAEVTSDDGADSSRFGGAVLYDFTPFSTLSPYVVAGAGAWDGTRYAEVGVGLNYKLTRNLHVAADVRGGIHCDTCTDEPRAVDYEGVTSRPVDDGDENGSRYTRARMSAILHF
jgi:hypothetical protein